MTIVPCAVHVDGAIVTIGRCVSTSRLRDVTTRSGVVTLHGARVTPHAAKVTPHGREVTPQVGERMIGMRGGGMSGGVQGAAGGALVASGQNDISTGILIEGTNQGVLTLPTPPLSAHGNSIPSTSCVEGAQSAAFRYGHFALTLRATICALEMLQFPFLQCSAVAACHGLGCGV